MSYTALILLLSIEIEKMLRDLVDKIINQLRFSRVPLM